MADVSAFFQRFILKDWPGALLDVYGSHLAPMKSGIAEPDWQINNMLYTDESGARYRTIICAYREAWIEDSCFYERSHQFVVLGRKLADTEA